MAEVARSELFLLTREQILQIRPYFPLSHGDERVDDRKMISGIMFIIRNGLHGGMPLWRMGRARPCVIRFVRWSQMCVFYSIFTELAKRPEGTAQLMIDATHLKAHRTAASLRKKGWRVAALAGPTVG